MVTGLNFLSLNDWNIIELNRIYYEESPDF